MRGALFTISIAILLALFGYAGWLSRTSRPTSIDEIDVERPNIVIRGHGLSKVEVWEMPSGTSLQETDRQLLGTAKLFSTTASSTGDSASDVWKFPIPLKPVLATEISAKGYDEKGTL